MIVNYPRMRRRTAWPSDLDTALEFTSPEVFSISAPKNWYGKLEYTNGSGWKTWDGNAIASGKIENNHCIYLRGTGNSKITGGVGNTAWNITGTNIACNGDIDRLLDYAAVRSGKRPAMANSCYANMFRNCTSLTTAPSLPATTLANRCYAYMFFGCTSLTTAPLSLPATTLTNSCYASMFRNCTSLTTAPSLPATTLADSCYDYMFCGCTSLTAAPSLPATTLKGYCYYSMFDGCTKIKLSTTAAGTYTNPYRIPKSGTGTTAASALSNMFANTGGTFKGTPTINTTYYLDESNTIV